MIVDASVAIKWLVEEDDSDAAEALLERTDLIAPDLIVGEIANAMWKKWARRELSGLPAALGSVMSVFETIYPSTPYLARSAAIAIELNHPAYDCFYLALAEETGAKIVTADVKLMRKLAATDFAEMVVQLGDAV